MMPEIFFVIAVSYFQTVNFPSLNSMGLIATSEERQIFGLS